MNRGLIIGIGVGVVAVFILVIISPVATQNIQEETPLSELTPWANRR